MLYYLNERGEMCIYVCGEFDRFPAQTQPVVNIYESFGLNIIMIVIQRNEWQYPN